MRKTIVVLAMVVGLAGFHLGAEARGGGGGGGGGGGRGGEMGSVYQGGGGGMQRAGDMNRYQHQERQRVQDGTQTGSAIRAQERLQVQDGTQAGSATRSQTRQQLRDPELHTTPPAAPPTE